MKILVVNYEYPPIGGGGGSCCKEIVQNLANKGYQIDVFTAGYKKFKKFEKVNDNLTIYKIKSNRKSENEVGFFGLITFLIRALFKIRKIIKKNQYDIIHYHFSVPTGLLTFFHSKKVPYIVTLHGIDVPGFHADEFPLFQKLTRPFNKRIIKNAARVVAVSNNLKEKALETFKNVKIDVIYHGVDITKFKIIDKHTERDFIHFICVARLVKFKRIDVLLRAYKIFLQKNQLKSQLTIIGTGYLKETLIQLSIELGIYDNVKFRGYVSNEEIPDFLNDADIFTLPTVYDSFGIVFIEAMACGLPCIGAKSAGVPEVVRDNFTGLLAEPDDEVSFAECMIKLANNNELRRKLGKNAHHTIINSYSWDHIVKSYITMFNEVKNK